MTKCFFDLNKREIPLMTVSVLLDGRLTSIVVRVGGAAVCEKVLVGKRLQRILPAEAFCKVILGWLTLNTVVEEFPEELIDLGFLRCLTDHADPGRSHGLDARCIGSVLVQSSVVPLLIS